MPHGEASANAEKELANKDVAERFERLLANFKGQRALHP